MERQPRPQDISWLLDLNSRGQIDLDPPYQRRSVWTRKDKEYFIDTIFHNYPSPAIFLHRTIDDDGQTFYHVVDGKQRVQSIFDFVEDKISIPNSFGDVRLDGKKWQDLGTDDRHRFWNYVITVEMLPSVDETVVNNVFERINRNARKLVPQELRHAKFNGWFINQAEAEALNDVWKKLSVSTSARIKRMADVQFVSELMIVVLKRGVVGFDQDVISQVYADYDDLEDAPYEFSEEGFRESFTSVRDKIEGMVAAEPNILNHLKNLANFYSLWTYVATRVDDIGEFDDLAESYDAFMSDVAQKIEMVKTGDSLPGEATELDRAAFAYAANVRGASTDFTPRQARHDNLTSGMAVLR